MNVTRRWTGLTALLLFTLACSGTGTAEEGPTTTEPVDRRHGETRPGVSGIWLVQVDRMSIWAPHSTLEKRFGLVYWKISHDGSDLTVAEYIPEGDGTDVPPDEIWDAPFQELEISHIQLDGEKFSFRENGFRGSYEKYEIQTVKPKELVGTYTIYDPYSPPGKGPTFKGRLFLDRVRRADSPEADSPEYY